MNRTDLKKALEQYKAGKLDADTFLDIVETEQAVEQGVPRSIDLTSPAPERSEMVMRAQAAIDRWENRGV